MNDDFEYNWELQSKISTIEANAKKEEAQIQLAKNFVKLLIEELKSKNLPLTMPVSWLTQKDIAQRFEYPKIYNSYVSPDYRSKQEFEHPSFYAAEYGLIKLNHATKPYTYTLIQEENQQKTFFLRPYQRSIIKQVSVVGKSVLIEAPTGAGKSVIASNIAKNEIEKGGQVLVVAPKIILLEQLENTFNELSPQIIHGPGEYDVTHSIFISTLQTAYKRELGFNPTMIIIDEIHYGFTGKMIEQLLSKFNGRLIGLSATPYDQNGVPLQGFDYHINQYDLNYMLDNGYLVYPLCYAPIKVNLAPISIVAGDYNQTELDTEFNNIENISRVVDATKDMIIKSQSSLVFCINISHAEAMAQVYNEQGVSSKAIHSKLSKEEQKIIMGDFKAGRLKVLTNPIMLTTGFDYPATDCIVLARATRSQNLYRQMVGRALRLSKNKKSAIILDCSNVIDDLGLPTKPIQPKETKVKSILTCRECEGNKFFTRIKNDNAYRICATCADEHLIEKRGNECEVCGLLANETTKYFTKNDALYMVCQECNHHTLIEHTTSKQELEAIFDMTFVKRLQKEFSLLFMKHLLGNYEPGFAFSAEISRHVLALQMAIVKDAYKFIGIEGIYDLSRIDDFLKSHRDEGFNGNMWELDRYRGWRLFSKKYEDRILNEDVAIIKEKIEEVQYIDDLWSLINQANAKDGAEPLSESLLDQLQNEIRNSRINEIEEMVVKRVKKLYFENEPIEKINGFVKMMEEVLI